MALQELRQKIDVIDEEMIRLFCQRMEVSRKIGAYKKERDLPIFVPQREQEKLMDIADRAGELSDYAVKLYETIFSLSREYQSEES